MPQSSPERFIKRLLWLYLFLLIIEGALRKWALPSLSNPLLVVRDPIVLLIYFSYLRHYQSKPGPFMINLIILAGCSVLFSLFSDETSWTVTAYGIRINYFHLPLIFVMGNILTREDVYAMGRMILWISIPMTVLMIAQFYAPYTHFINKKPGGITGVSVAGAFGRFRPPGTFAFISGPAAFYPLATAMLINIVIHKKAAKFILIIASGGAILLAVPFSISRLLALSCAIVIATGAYCLYCLPGLSKALLRIFIIGCVILVGINFLPMFDEGVRTFERRWDNTTSETHGGVKTAIIDRFLNTLTEPFDLLDSIPLTGYGIGLGSNVGAKITTGKTGFLMGEYEWTRNISELGPILGLCFILYRIALVYFLFICSYRALRKQNSLPILIFSACFLLVLNGQWGPPTILGFTVFGGGLCLAACNAPEENAIQKKRRRLLASRTLAGTQFRKKRFTKSPLPKPPPAQEA